LIKWAIEQIIPNKQKIITVNDIISKELEIDNYVNLFPTLKESVPWSIDLDEYFIINSYITKFADNTTDYLIDLNLFNINATREALTKLIRPNVALICYIIFYRLIRVMRLLDKYEPSNILLLNTRLFTPPCSIKDLYNITRDSWEFNQFIINEILYDVEKVDIEKKNDLYPDDYWDFSRWSNYDGFNQKPDSIPKRNKIKTFISDPFEAIKSKFDEIEYKLSSYGNQIPVLAMGYNESFLMKKGFFWPRGKFCKLPQYLPDSVNVINQNKTLRKNCSDKTKQYFIEGALNLFRELNIESSYENYIENISKIFFNIYPISMLEQANEYNTWSYKQISKFNNKQYFTYDTGSSDLGIYYNYAATELRFKVWSQQHSAWGGYLADVPNIAEISIAGSDYYITSGWDHKESHLPVWANKARPMSSPHYSEIGKKKITVKDKTPVLLLTGDVYNFPIFPAGSHEVDTLKFWAENIEDIISNLAALDVEIILKNYAPRAENLLIKYGILEKWMQAGGKNIKLLDINKKGSAYLYFEKSSATIWDMPSGGFVESIMMGVPAFSFWNKKFIRCQPEADDEINKLIDVGILNENGHEMANNVNACIEDRNWWNKTIRKMTIDNFMSHYIKTSTQWKSEWSSLLNSLE
jgi:hypothetical protein